jgi:hypothetical protein
MTTAPRYAALLKKRNLQTCQVEALQSKEKDPLGTLRVESSGQRLSDVGRRTHLFVLISLRRVPRPSQSRFCGGKGGSRKTNGPNLFVTLLIPAVNKAVLRCLASPPRRCRRLRLTAGISVLGSPQG